MIHQEERNINGVAFIYTYTDSEGMMLRKVGTDEIYGEAYDLAEYPQQYEEIESMEGEGDDEE